MRRAAGRRLMQHVRVTLRRDEASADYQGRNLDSNSSRQHSRDAEENGLPTTKGIVQRHRTQ